MEWQVSSQSELRTVEATLGPPEHSSVVISERAPLWGVPATKLKPLNYEEGAMDAFLLKSTKAFHLTE